MIILWLEFYITFEGPSQKEGPGVLATVLPLADKGLIFGDNSPFWEHGSIVCFHGLKVNMTWDRKARGGMLNIPQPVSDLRTSISIPVLF